jgi:hypothetical protein
MKKNWKTTLSSIIAATGVTALGYVTEHPGLFIRWPWVTPVATILAASGVLGTGLYAKDSDVHSTVDEVVESTTARNRATAAAANDVSRETFPPEPPNP